MKETSLVKQHIIYTLYFYYMINILSNYYQNLFAGKLIHFLLYRKKKKIEK